MILSDNKIRAGIDFCKLVEGATDNQINPASVNLTLGNTFLTISPDQREYVLGEEVEYDRHEIPDSIGFALEPGMFTLATTKERVNIPNGFAAFVQGRSSIGRVGLTTQNAGFVDPGFHGHITLELVNESPSTIILKPGYPVAQLVFFECYSSEKPYRGKYNDQVEATGSRMHMDRVSE